MAQGYYTLDEAAKILGITPEKLTKLAQDPTWLKKVHAFRDQKVLRFRSQDIDALAGQGGGRDPGVFDFPMPESSEVGIGHEPLGEGSSSSPNPKGPGKGKKMDSDVHLVMEGEDEFNPASDSGIKKDSGSSSKSDVKLGVLPESSGGSKVDSGTGSKPGSGARKKTMIPPGSRVDSPVRLVPMSSSDEVDIPHERGADSDVALGGSHPSGGKAYPGAGQETEEVDLDAEMRRAEAGQKPSSKVKPKSGVGERGHFEVSEGPRASSDESTELDLSAEDIHLEHGEDVSLGELTPKDKIKGASGTSGLQMHSPADSGVDLEKAGELDESEFELSLEASDHGKSKGPKTPAAAEPEGSSEFELTLEDSGKLAPLEEGGDKDIFESDFDMPALEEESGSEVAALEEPDTDLDSSSDFDLALNEEDAAAEGESGSQVVTLDEEEADEAAATVARPRPKPEEGEAEEIDELLGEEAAPEAEEEAVVAAAPTEWGLLPAIVMTPAVLIMILVGLLSFELVHSMWGYKQPSGASGPVTEFFVHNFVPEKDWPDEMKSKKR
jgi:hypothetical protein